MANKFPRSFVYVNPNDFTDREIFKLGAIDNNGHGYYLSNIDEFIRADEWLLSDCDRNAAGEWEVNEFALNGLYFEFDANTGKLSADVVVALSAPDTVVLTDEMASFIEKHTGHSVDLVDKTYVFQDEPWYNALHTYLSVEACCPAPQDVPDVCDALAYMGLAVRVTEFENQLYIVPAKGKVLSWESMNEKYPIAREDMSLDIEREFVNDCFDIYEREGFADKFWSPFSDFGERLGQPFVVVERCMEPDFDVDVLPMWKIRFEDGTVVPAHPTEIVPSEMLANGCPYFNDVSLEQRVVDATQRSSRLIDVGSVGQGLVHEHSIE